VSRPKDDLWKAAFTVSYSNFPSKSRGIGSMPQEMNWRSGVGWGLAAMAPVTVIDDVEADTGIISGGEKVGRRWKSVKIAAARLIF